MTQRIRSLDSFRGIAILLMFLHHFPHILLESRNDSVTFHIEFIISRLAIPMFLFAVGVSLYLSFEKRRNESVIQTIFYLAIRGYTIMFFGLCLMALSHETSFGNILIIIGACICIAIFFLVPDSDKLSLTAFIIIVAMLSKQGLDGSYSGHMAVGSPDSNTIAILAPFFLFVLAGMVYSKKMLNKNGWRSIGKLTVSSAILIVFWSVSIVLMYWGAGFLLDVTHISFNLIALGVCLPLISGLGHLENHGRWEEINQVFSVFGRHAFNLYIIHTSMLILMSKLGYFKFLNNMTTTIILIFFIGVSYFWIKRVEERKPGFLTFLPRL